MEFQNRITGNDFKALETQVRQFNSKIGKSTAEQNQGLDKDAFLKLLTVQLSKQNPLSPMDNTAFIAQMAQFTSLEQMKNMNQEMAALRGDFSKQSALALIGKTVSFLDPVEGTAHQGAVERVLFSGGGASPRVFIGGREIPYEQIISVAIPSPPPASSITAGVKNEAR